MSRPALFRRFPVGLRVTSHPILPAAVAAEHPALADDIAFADEVVGPAFAECDTEALRQQKAYRLQQVVVILGAALVSVLGSVQAALPQYRWPGLLLVLLGLVLGFLGRTSQELQSFEAFLDERIKAERLRSTYFRYLSRTRRYGRRDRDRKLKLAVLQIRKGEEPE